MDAADDERPTCAVCDRTIAPGARVLLVTAAHDHDGNLYDADYREPPWVCCTRTCARKAVSYAWATD